MLLSATVLLMVLLPAQGWPVLQVSDIIIRVSLKLVTGALCLTADCEIEDYVVEHGQPLEDECSSW